MYHLLFICFLLPLMAKPTIRDVCDQFARPFTLLHINADDDDTIFDLAKEYPQATFVYTQQNKGLKMHAATNLLNRAKSIPDLNNVVILNVNLNEANLCLLSTCEYFDVVITKEKNTDTINTLGQFIFLNEELLSQNDRDFIEKQLLFRDESVQKSYTLSETGMQTISYCARTKTTHAITKIPGISLISFQTFRGIYPENTDIINQLKNTQTKNWYKRATPWNTIISGKSINFEIAPDKTPLQKDTLCPTLYDLWDEFFTCKSKREMRELIENNYFD